MDPLVFDDRRPAGDPGLHALVIGVNDYPFGPKAGGSEWRPLTAAVPSATAFARWLYTKHRDSRTPLRSLRVLLSPGPLVVESSGRPRLDTAVPSARFANVVAAFQDWWKDCDDNADNTALFYFCGHGCEPRERCLLAEDAGEVAGNPWDNFINFDLTYDAMSRNAAKVQLFFLDACREIPKSAFAAQAQIGRPLRTPIVTGVAVMRDAPIYMAAPAQGYMAKAPVGGVSAFTKGLVDCLDRYGASHQEGMNPWIVNTSSLRDALREYTVRQQVGGTRLAVGNSGESSGEVGKIHEIHGSALVLTSLFATPPLDPLTARFTVSLRSAASVPLDGGAPKVEAVLEPGEYRVVLSSPDFEDIVSTEMVMPPVRAIRLPGSSHNPVRKAP